MKRRLTLTKKCVIHLEMVPDGAGGVCADSYCTGDASGAVLGLHVLIKTAAQTIGCTYEELVKFLAGVGSSETLEIDAKAIIDMLKENDQ